MLWNFITFNRGKGGVSAPPFINLGIFPSLMLFAMNVFGAGFYVDPPGQLLRQSVGFVNVTVRNPTEEPILLRIEVLPSGEENPRYRDGGFESQILVSRPLRILPPNQSTEITLIDGGGRKSELVTESIFLVSIEGSKPPEENDAVASASFVVRQVIPLFYRPDSVEVLDLNDRTGLVKSTEDGGVYIQNTSPYIFRLADDVVAKGSGIKGVPEKSYILPGRKVRVVFEEEPGSLEQGLLVKPISYTGGIGDEIEVL